MPEVTPKLAKTHPVPQHIAAFEFKLVGDLTLRQFLYAGVGLAVAYAAYISELDSLIKWGIIVFAGGLGLGLAFFPIQDRGLDTWITNLIWAMTSPTQRIWGKAPLPPAYFQKDYTQVLSSQALSLTPPEKRTRLDEYLKIPKKEAAEDLGEKEFLDRLNFNLPPSTPPPEPHRAPEPEARPGPAIPPPKSFAERLTKEKRLEELERQNLGLGQKIAQAKEELKKLESVKEELYTKSEAYRLRLLEQESLLKRLGREKEETQLSVQAIADHSEPPTLIFPDGEGRPNIIRGFVKDSQNKLLQNVVIIVKDQDGDPVRALKTGETGQFLSATPLQDGEYTIEGSLRGKKFDIIKSKLSGKVVEPIALKERYRG